MLFRRGSGMSGTRAWERKAAHPFPPRMLTEWVGASHRKWAGGAAFVRASPNRASRSLDGHDFPAGVHLDIAHFPRLRLALNFVVAVRLIPRPFEFDVWQGFTDPLLLGRRHLIDRHDLILRLCLDASPGH